MQQDENQLRYRFLITHRLLRLVTGCLWAFLPVSSTHWPTLHRGKFRRMTLRPDALTAFRRLRLIALVSRCLPVAACTPMAFD